MKQRGRGADKQSYVDVGGGVECGTVVKQEDEEGLTSEKTAGFFFFFSSLVGHESKVRKEKSENKTIPKGKTRRIVTVHVDARRREKKRKIAFFCV